MVASLACIIIDVAAILNDLSGQRVNRLTCLAIQDVSSADFLGGKKKTSFYLWMSGECCRKIWQNEFFILWGRKTLKKKQKPSFPQAIY